MKKNAIKYCVDTLMFVDMCSIAVIGLIMAFVIPAGGGRDSDKYFLGLHRHDWGDIHLYLALFFLALLVLHIWLSWTWVVSSTKSYFGDHWKKTLMTLCGAWVVVLIIGWLVATLR